MANEENHVYPQTASNTIKRHRERGHYDTEAVHSIVNTAPVAHVSFVPDPSNPAPVILPMIARIGHFSGAEEASAYIHGYVSTLLFRPRTASSLPANATHEEEGFPICIAATKIVNLVLSLTPFSHSYDYRSAVVHGHASLLDPEADHEEIIYAMQLITDGMVPQRWANSRTPPNASEIAATRILKVRIDSASAKIRDSGVKEEAKDLKNAAATNNVWTGIIPYVEMLGVPLPAPTNKVAAVPQYIQDHVRAHNEAAGADGVKGLISKLVSSVFGR
ncbi:uncharacterized protein BCR38DRAFT_336053 [Pseudomassariella vexata]|uniref:Uncharacterized protein n=1 Tax=Pseudomassariella vexata TaxID=1141098 RepID=A0A1Y2E9V3_9PEZI|nr:uncharacterized protein BCR38DRAFT_336053 [Pseudomassariella vexata]ORY68177.1 hypothetical protein BCR38DRAFT_336053 [Pseudomassariella vexata]